jgi:hypothetical protein
MKMLLGLAATFSFAICAHATDETKLKSLSKKGRGAKIQLSNVDTEVRQGVNVDKEVLKKVRSRIPSPADRDAAFEKAGVTETVAGWSEYDKDMLALRGKEFSTDQFASAYPNLDAPARNKLQGFLKK